MHFLAQKSIATDFCISKKIFNVRKGKKTMGVKRSIKPYQKQLIITIGDAFKKFSAEKAVKGVVEKTLHNYRQSLDYFMEEYSIYDDFDVSQINKDMVLEWQAALMKKGISPSSINHYTRDLRTFLYWCMKDENKFIYHFKIEEMSAQTPPPKKYEDNDLKKLLEKPKSDDYVEWRNWVMVNLMYDMGGRIGSVVEIQMQDVNLEQRFVYLRHTKNKELAYSPLSSHCVRILKEYKHKWRHDAEPDEPFFCQTNLEPLTYSAAAQAFRKYCNKRGVKQHSMHGIRHSFATTLAKSTHDVVKVQKALGHRSIRMAQKYIDMTSINIDADRESPLAQISKGNGRPENKIKKN